MEKDHKVHIAIFGFLTFIEMHSIIHDKNTCSRCLISIKPCTSGRANALECTSSLKPIGNKVFNIMVFYTNTDD